MYILKIAHVIIYKKNFSEHIMWYFFHSEDSLSHHFCLSGDSLKYFSEDRQRPTIPDEQKRASHVRRSLEESMMKVIPGFFREYSTQVILGLKTFCSIPRFIPNLTIHTFFPKFLKTPNRNIM